MDITSTILLFNKLNKSDFVTINEYLFICGKPNNSIIELPEFNEISDKYFNVDIINNVSETLTQTLDSLKTSMSLGQLICIQKYSLIEEIKTMMHVKILITNNTMIKKKIVSATFITDYKGLESIKYSKAKNDMIVCRFINDNANINPNP